MIKMNDKMIDINVYAHVRGSMLVSQLPYAKDILDLGAGRGDFAMYYPYITNITFVDKDSDECGSFSKYCVPRYTAPRFKHIRASCDNLSMIADNSFDMVIMSQMIEHLTDEQVNNTMKEIKRVLRSGGYLAMSTPNIVTRKLVGKYLANEFHIKEYTNEELLSIHRLHGFNVILNKGILRVAEGKVWLNEEPHTPEEGYWLWMLSTTSITTK